MSTTTHEKPKPSESTASRPYRPPKIRKEGIPVGQILPMANP